MTLLDDNEIKPVIEDLIRALESGEFEQIRFVVCRKKDVSILRDMLDKWFYTVTVGPKTHCFCAIGVLGYTVNGPNVHPIHTGEPYRIQDIALSDLSNEITRYLNLDYSLITMNDTLRMSFKQIANELKKKMMEIDNASKGHQLET